MFQPFQPQDDCRGPESTINISSVTAGRRTFESLVEAKAYNRPMTMVNPNAGNPMFTYWGGLILTYDTPPSGRRFPCTPWQFPICIDLIGRIQMASTPQSPRFARCSSSQLPRQNARTPCISILYQHVSVFRSHCSSLVQPRSDPRMPCGPFPIYPIPRPNKQFSQSPLSSKQQVYMPVPLRRICAVSMGRAPGLATKRPCVATKIQPYTFLSRFPFRFSTLTSTLLALTKALLSHLRNGKVTNASTHTDTRALISKHAGNTILGSHSSFPISHSSRRRTDEHLHRLNTRIPPPRTMRRKGSLDHCARHGVWLR